MSALAEAALAASREADADAAEAARAAAVAAAVAERKKLMQADAVALGREAIGTLPYFDDLGLASDEAFLSALGSLADARRFETQVALAIVPERAAEAEALKALKHLGDLTEPLTELEKMRGEAASAAEESKAKPADKDLTRKQAEKAEKAEAKLQSKLTMLRAKAKKEGVKLPGNAELPTTLAEAEALRQAVSAAYMQHSQLRRQLDLRMRLADNVRTEANKTLDDAVSAAYKSQALASHPDKRRGAESTHEDTLRFQRVRTAYETLRDAEQRKAYIDTFDHDKFLGQQAAAAAAAEMAEARASGGGRGGGGGSVLRLGGGAPNKCACPTVSVVGDSAAMLQWSCSGAAASDVYGYDVHGARVVAGTASRDWRALAVAAQQPATRLLASGLAPGEWQFKVRAVNHAGPGDWSMVTETVLVGDEGAADPEAAARRLAEARAVAERRRKEAQEGARNALYRWAHPNARRSPDLLDELSRAVGSARRAGLPVAQADARLLQTADDTIRELRASAAQRAAIKEWRPQLRELVKSAPVDDDAAAKFVSLVQAFVPDELDAAVRDHCHQLLKKCAAMAKERAGDAAALERVIPVLQAAAERTDLWPPAKIDELVACAASLQKAVDTAQLVAARALAAEQRRAAKAAAAAAAAQAAKAAAAQQRDASMASERADAARAAAAHIVAAQARMAAAAPTLAAQAVARDELDCPICLDTYCSAAGKMPLAFGCGHVVCAECLAQLRTSMARHHCPACREPFDPAAQFGVAEEVRDAALRALRRAEQDAPAEVAQQPPRQQQMPAPKMALPQPATPVPVPVPMPMPVPVPAPVQRGGRPLPRAPAPAAPVTPQAQPSNKKNKKGKAAQPPPLPKFLSGFALPPLPQAAPAAASAPLPPLPTQQSSQNFAERFAFLFPT